MNSWRKLNKVMLILGTMLLFALSVLLPDFKSGSSLVRVRNSRFAQVQAERSEPSQFRDAIDFKEDVNLVEEESESDYPNEAARFRRLQLQDEKGFIPVDGLEKARQQVKQMRTASQGIIKPNSWTWLGPGNVGGRIRSIVISPTNTNTMWVGSVSGGIWRTDNGGDSWFPVNDFLANLAVSTMVINSTTPSTMYAGTGEVNGSQNTQGAGIFKSTDSGLTWNQLPATNPTAPPPTGCGGSANCPWLYVNRLAISPNGNTILAATWQGIQRSTDAGATWNLTAGVSGSWLDIDFHPTDNQRAIAGASGSSVFSTNGGQSWTAANFIPLINGRVELAYAPSNPMIIYASVNNNNGEVYRSIDGNSTNGSQTFTLVNTGTNFFQNSTGSQGEYDNIIWVNPQDTSFVLVGGIDLWRSTTSGLTFSKISQWQSAPGSSAHADHHAIVAHPGYNNTSNRVVFFGNDGGFYRANDVQTVVETSGWINQNRQLGITQFYSAAGNPVTGGIIGGAQDNGNVLYRGGTETWLPIVGLGGDGGFCAADPESNLFYGEYIYLQIRRTIAGGTTGGDIDFGITDAENPATANFIAPFILDPNNYNTMLAGGISLWRSNDVKSFIPAPTWAAIKTPSGASNPISAIAVAPGISNYIVVGHNNGDIYRTLNGTSNTPGWMKIDLPAPALPDRFVTRLVIDSTRNPNWIYATFGGFSADNVYRTTDNGLTWNDITGTGVSGLPNVPIRSLVYHPTNPNLLYVGTEIGIFSSDDAGANWEVPQNGPANVSVDELFRMGGDLIAATHGRGLYRASGGIYVDCNYIGIQLGTFDQPYRTVAAALNAATVYRTIWIKPCTYNEPMTINKINGVEIRSLGGTAVIGRP